MLYTLFGSVLLLVGVFTVVAAAGTADIVALTVARGAVADGTQLAAFILFAVAFAVKSPLWPLHTWLPDAHTEAPTVGSVILAGVLLKMGTYGLIRVAVGVAPEGARGAAPVLGVLAVAAIIVGGLVCLAQTELKRLIAYSSRRPHGLRPARHRHAHRIGFQAALIGNIAHGVITGLLFFLAGAIKDRSHTGELGRARRAPRGARGWPGCWASPRSPRSGCPGWPASGARRSRWSPRPRGGPLWIRWQCSPRSAAALAAAYFLRMLRRVTHGPASPAVAALRRPGSAPNWWRGRRWSCWRSPWGWCRRWSLGPVGGRSTVWWGW